MSWKQIGTTEEELTSITWKNTSSASCIISKLYVKIGVANNTVICNKGKSKKTAQQIFNYNDRAAGAVDFVYGPHLDPAKNANAITGGIVYYWHWNASDEKDYNFGQLTSGGTWYKWASSSTADTPTSAQVKSKAATIFGSASKTYTGTGTSWTGKVYNGSTQLASFTVGTDEYGCEQGGSTSPTTLTNTVATTSGYSSVGTALKPVGGTETYSAGDVCIIPGSNISGYCQYQSAYPYPSDGIGKEVKLKPAVQVDPGKSVTLKLKGSSTGNTIAVYGDMSVNPESLKDYGPYYPWLKYKKSDDSWSFPGYNEKGSDEFEPGVDFVKYAFKDYKPEDPDVYKPIYINGKFPMVYKDGNWIKYEKSVHFPGKYNSQKSTINPAVFKWYWTDGSKFTMDFCLNTALTTNNGYMLLELHTKDQTSPTTTGAALRIGCFYKSTVTGDGDYYIYINRTTSTTELHSNKVFYIGQRYRLTISKSESTTTMIVLNTDGIPVCNINNNEVSDYTTDAYIHMFASQSFDDRMLKGTVYSISLEDEAHGKHTFDLNLCSVGYDKLRQTDLDENYKFKSNNTIPLNNGLVVSGEWVEV